MKDSKCCVTGTRFFSSASADRLDSVLCSTLEGSPNKASPLSAESSDHKVGAHHDIRRRPSLPHSVHAQQALASSNFGSDCLGKACVPSTLLLDIRDFCKQGLLDSALHALSLLDPYSVSPPEDLYWLLLKACGNQKALTQAKQVQGSLARHGEGLSSSLLDYLVSTLAKCGGLEEALYVFHQLPHRTVFSWTAVISAYTECGKGWQALETYGRMQEEGVQPNEYTFVSLLKACGSLPDLEKGKELHTYASMKGLEAHDFVGSALVSMYGKCTSMMEAEKVFDSLSKGNVVSWNAMLSAYADQGEGEKALWLYEKLEEEGTEPNERTFVILIQACCLLAENEEAVTIGGIPIKSESLEAGKRLYAHVQSKGFKSNAFIGNILVSMFGKCGSIFEAESVFLGMSTCTVISWSAMLSAYNEYGEAEKTLQLFSKMQGTFVRPNEWIFVIALQACCMLAEKNDFLSAQGQKMKLLPLDVGRALHVDARRKGYDLDACVGSTLVNLYGKCGSIHEAECVFVGLSHCNIAVWNALLSAYVEQEDGDTALRLYKVMQEEGVSPDEQTSVITLQACCILAVREEAVVIQGRSTKKVSLEIGRALHTDAQKRGFDPDVFLGSTLVSMYGKCGSIFDAENVFGRLFDQDAVAWTAMLSAYGEQGFVQKAFELYRQMQDKDVLLDDATLVSVVQACRETGTLELCRRIHFDILSTRHDPSLLLTTAFIHAYGSCASMVDAWAVFDVLLEPDVVSWSALIAGYAKEGSFASSFQTYETMKRAGIEPNEVTFLSLLSTCSHAGLVNKGVEIFESMSVEYKLRPKIEHFVTVVDLLGRVGYLERAEDMLSRLPGQPDLAIWLCLLSACRKHGNLELGERVFDRAVLLHPNKAAAYVMMSNIYNDTGLHTYASEIDHFRHQEGAWKKPGQSWIEHEHEVHSFVVGDCKHPQQEHLYNLLRQLSVKLRKEGQLPYTEHILSGNMEH